MTCSSGLRICAVIVGMLLSVIRSSVDAQATSNSASPCPNIFKYQYNADVGEYWGLVQVPSPPLGSTLHLTVNLTLNARLPTSYVGRLELFDAREVTIKRITNGMPVRYKVLFPLQFPYPRLTYITYNNHVLCSGDTGFNNMNGYVTQIALEHKLYTTLAGDRRYPLPYSALQSGAGGTGGGNFGPSVPKKQPSRHQMMHNKMPLRTTTTTSTTTSTTPSPSVEENLEIFDFHNNFQTLSDIDMRIKESEDVNTCGRVDPHHDITWLVLGGQEVQRGQWPWLAAIHVYQQTALNFRCGGNLISSKLVISAAHCFKGREGMQFNTEDIVVSLGQHNIRRLHDASTISMGLESLNVHPEFLKDPKGSYDADIAVLVLERAVTFSEFIKPVCLWSGDPDETAVFGKTGVIVGWGKDESGHLVTKAPKRASVPIVSHLECIRSSETFLRITSARTLCGGAKNDSGPCNGDSGGGLILFEDGVWQLRGIISVALADPITGMCNLKQYVVFTDVAKFITWINSFD